ncbi:integral membrane protein DUF106-domain-containing protein [Pelagophyceae sp. CCMP2097]|nr:integral membrane protein DUF106-domain-containing protein [Pelagophyceae sp. CCMP2097]
MADPEMLLLDPAIRDWVVLPMVAIMVLMGLCRHYALILLKSNTKMDAAEMQQRQVLMRAARIRTRGKRPRQNLLPAESFHARRSYLCAKESGVLCVKVKKSGNNPMMNPLGMVDQMKGNMVYMVPNMAMMGIISFFFQGFVLVKVPFPLTQRFKIMLQRGVDLESLDVSYVSSLSWYFLVMFGLRGFFKILLGEDSDALDEARSTQMQMGMGMGGGGGGVFDAPAAYKFERENLEMAPHAWALDAVELELVGPKQAARIQAAAQRATSSDAANADKRASDKKRRVKLAKAKK